MPFCSLAGATVRMWRLIVGRLIIVTAKLVGSMLIQLMRKREREWKERWGVWRFGAHGVEREGERDLFKVCVNFSSK